VVSYSAIWSFTPTSPSATRTHRRLRSDYGNRPARRFRPGHLLCRRQSLQSCRRQRRCDGGATLYPVATTRAQLAAQLATVSTGMRTRHNTSPMFATIPDAASHRKGSTALMSMRQPSLQPAAATGSIGPIGITIRLTFLTDRPRNCDCQRLIRLTLNSKRSMANLPWIASTYLSRSLSMDLIGGSCLPWRAGNLAPHPSAGHGGRTGRSFMPPCARLWQQLLRELMDASIR